MCAYETGLKCRHYRRNGHDQSAWALPLAPGAAGAMQDFGAHEMPQWGGSGIKDFDGCWRNAEGRFLLMEAKSQLVGQSGKRNLDSIIGKLQVWLDNVHLTSKEESNRWTWQRLTYKPLRGAREADWMNMEVHPSRLVIVTPAVDDRRWNKLITFVHGHKICFQSAELWRLHAPIDTSNEAKNRSVAFVHDMLAASPSN